MPSVNAAMFAITTDSEFKINTYAYTAIATSTAACGLGIACDIWFLFRYIWVDLETFRVRIPKSPTSSCADIVVHSIALVTYMIHTFPFPCRHAYPLCAR